MKTMSLYFPFVHHPFMNIYAITQIYRIYRDMNYIIHKIWTILFTRYELYYSQDMNYIIHKIWTVSLLSGSFVLSSYFRKRLNNVDRITLYNNDCIVIIFLSSCINSLVMTTKLYSLIINDRHTLQFSSYLFNVLSHSSDVEVLIFISSLF